MAYGWQTRSWNRSTEAREFKKQQAETTRRYLAGELTIDGRIELFCNCRSFEHAHPIEAHNQLDGDHDWRTPAERGQIRKWKEPIK